MNRVQAGLFDFLEKAVSPFHSVKAGISLLEEKGFTPLSLSHTWSLTPGKAYYTRVFGSTLLAFRIGRKPRSHLHIATAHTDFPCLRIKPHAEIQTQQYGKLNVEVYGGMIRNTWLDRPLSLAGKIVLRSDDAYHPDVRYVDARRPLLTIPHLAIHMNPTVNEGEKLNPQKDMLPLFTLTDRDSYGDDRSVFLQFLADEFSLQAADILSYELTVYPTEPPCLLGRNNEFISASRLDNQTSVYACLMGLIHGTSTDGINLIALFDNEEVGSRSKQGAASLVCPQILQRIYTGLGYTESELWADMSGGYVFSLDAAHAYHPNYPDKTDPTNLPVLNGGPVLKIACSQTYAGDAEAIAIARSLCESQDIPCQFFLNRSDMRGGSTLGSLLSANMPMRTMDIGLPLLAMHSARETMGAADQEALQKLMTLFFSR